MDKTLEEKLARYLELKREVDEKCAEMEDIKAELRAATEKAEDGRTLYVGDHKLLLCPGTRSSIDVKAFAAEHPRLAKKFTRESSYTSFRIN